MKINLDSPYRRKRAAVGTLGSALLFLAAAPSALRAQYQMSPPEFGDTYSFPSPEHPEPASEYLHILDVVLLTLALALAVKLVYKSRNRKGVILLSIASVAYFGFYRKGCICSVGAIQNVILSLVDPQYFISFSAIAIFFLPLLVTLFYGRVFCSGVCPLGALQDLVVLRPLRVPVKLDKALASLQYVYLGLAILFAGWGLQLALGPIDIDIGRRFIICDYDPFIPIFRRTGPFSMVLTGAIFLAVGTFIGRPYCRWLCPYGGILAILSRVSQRNVRISPDKELDCGLCADACPYGAIHELRADRASCMACTRCYDSCPRQKRLVALRAGPKKLPLKPAAPPPRWESIARTWTGIVAGILVICSAAWLLATYIHVQRVEPAELSLADSLREQATMDASIQEILQPELEKQQEAAVARRRVYNRVGLLLMISAGIFVAWYLWLRPKRGTGAGVPAKYLKFLEKPPPKRPAKPRKSLNDSPAAAE
jgi:polyferredoxin